jgi:hypothetical protein
MTDVNERIAADYFETLGYIVKTNEYYVKKGKRGGSGPSDIDLILLHPKSDGKYGKRAIVNVKGWHNYYFIKEELIKDYNKKYWEKLHFDKQLLKKAREVFGTNNFKKILVVSKLDPASRNYIVEKMPKIHHVEIIDFPMMLETLIKELNPNKNYGHSEFLQTIRMFKKYIFKKEFINNIYVEINLFIAFRLCEELDIHKHLFFGGENIIIKKGKITIGEEYLYQAPKDFLNKFNSFLNKRGNSSYVLDKSDLKKIWIESQQFRKSMKYYDQIQNVSKPYLKKIK